MGERSSSSSRSSGRRVILKPNAAFASTPATEGDPSAAHGSALPSEPVEAGGVALGSVGYGGERGKFSAFPSEINEERILSL